MSVMDILVNFLGANPYQAVALPVVTGLASGISFLLTFFHQTNYVHQGYLGNPRQTLLTWYPNLRKSALTPPNYILPPIWTSLYALTGYASHLIARAAVETLREPTHILARYALGLYVDQLVLNLAWTPLFFGARRPRLALTCVSALFGVTASMVWCFWGIDRKAFALCLPYLGWLGYAWYLNYQIVKLNPNADEKGNEKSF
jgi:translocator protein